MANQQVAPVRTSFSTNQLVPAFVEAWKKLIGSDPAPTQIAMLLSHNALETGGFTTKAMFNYNIGNIVKTTQDNYDYFVHPDSYHGKKFMSKFRSYDSLTDGVYDYLKLLKKGYPQAFAATNQTPKDFAYALVANPKFQYYDATHAKEYAAGMTSLYNQIMKSNNFQQSIHQTQIQPSIDTQSQDMVSQLNNLLSKFIATLGSKQYKNNLQSYSDYQKYLPQHNFLIKITNDNSCYALEFARILSTAIQEELIATAQIHHQNINTEIECQIHGNQILCAKALTQLCGAVSDAFAIATPQLGNIKIATHIYPSLHSNYQELDIKLAEVNYQLFHQQISKAQ